jgi:CHAT domain-containing protein/tetratricopeptide (TPR) repeat protein
MKTFRALVACSLVAASLHAHPAAAGAPRATAVQRSELDEATKAHEEGMRLLAAGRYDEAVAQFERARVIRERVRGPMHPDVAGSLNALGRAHYEKGEYAIAEPLFLRALAIWERAFGPEDPRVGSAVNNLAVLYKEKGDYARAEPLYLRALAIREKAFGPDDPQVASALNNIALFYQSKGDYTRGEPLLMRALAIDEKALGPEHPIVASVLENLALLYEARGEYAAAEPRLERSRAIREKVLGPDHPDVALSLNNLASLYNDMGDSARAESMQQHALAINEKAFGRDSSNVALSLSNLATLYKQMGDYARAEDLYERALTTYQKALGPDHPAVAATLDEFASLCRLNGDYAHAESLYLRARDIDEKVLGPDHPDLAYLLSNFAVLYESMGDSVRAEALLQRSLSIRAKALGPDHPEVAVSLHNLAGLYMDQGDTVRAEPLFRLAIAIREKTLGPDHRDLAVSLNQLGRLYWSEGDSVQAEPLLRRALAIRQKALGPDHPSVASSLNNLAVLYARTGDTAGAEPLYLRALAINEKALGSDHPDVATVLFNLAACYLAQGDTARAASMLERGLDVRERHVVRIAAAGSEEQRKLYLATSRDDLDQTVSFHAQGAPNDPAARSLALLAVLRRKGRVLDATADTVGVLRAHMTPPDAELFDHLRALRADIAARTMSGALVGPGAEARRETLAKIGEQADRLEAQIADRSAEFRREIQPVTIDRVKRAIPPGAVLVEIVRYRPYDARSAWTARFAAAPRYAAYALRRDTEVSYADLGEAATIDELVRRFNVALADRNSNPYIAGRQLDARLGRPLRALAGDACHVLLAPDGQLNQVPFGALVDEHGDYLLGRYDFTYLTSGRDLFRLDVPSTMATTPPVVVANPNFGPPGPATPLPGTGAEGREVAKMLPGARALFGDAATKVAVVSLHSPRILHIATHGFFEPGMKASSGSESSGVAGGLAAELPESPLVHSGLIFAGFNRPGRKENGRLTALEASAMDLWGTKLVVLSACETGVGEVENGEGVYGLRRGLVLAGASTVVMSLWRVDDDATRDLMVAYYAALEKGGGRSEALRDAQLATFAMKGRRHPYFWAGFIPTGDWRSLEDAEVSIDAVQAPAAGFARVGPGACGCVVAGGRESPPRGAGLLVTLALAAAARRSGRRTVRRRMRRGNACRPWGSLHLSDQPEYNRR